MNVRDFEPAHIQLIAHAGGREVFGPLPFAPGHAEMCAENPAWSIFDGEQIVGCGGFFRDHVECVTAWTLLLPCSGPRMRFVHRAALEVLGRCEARRIQAHASPKFKPSMRWLCMLGFKYEGTLRKFTPSGDDMLLFARVR